MRRHVGTSVGQDVPEVGVEEPLRRQHRQPIHQVLRHGLRVWLTVLGEYLVIAISEGPVLRIES
jgi:hypothetical protein